MDIITSLDNSTVKYARSLNDKKYRRHYGEFLIESKKLITEAIKKGLQLSYIFVESSKAKELENLILCTDAPVVFCSKSVFNSVCDTVTSQGVIAVCKLPSVGLFAPSKNSKLIVLDSIQDPGNMGTIIRSAVATGITDILTINCTDPYSPKVVRASGGGIFTANIYPVTEEEVIQLHNKYNIALLVADMAGESIYNNLTQTNYALVIGNEGHGVSSLIKDCGKLVSLPMKNNTESLNAGICASVLMYLLEGKNI